MATPKEAFDESMKRAVSFLIAYRELHGKRGRVPTARADLLRGAVVFAVAAMDAYIRDTVAYHLAKVIAVQVRTKSALPKEFIRIIDSTMNTEALIKAAYASRTGSHIRSAVEGKLVQRSFQDPKAIEDAFKIIGLNDLIVKVAEIYGSKKKELEKTIRAITKRRHQIVHQADLHQDKKKKRKPREIKVSFVEEVLDTIRNFVNSIERIVSEHIQDIQ